MHAVLENAQHVARGISSSVITGANPVEFDSKNPITLFIVQLFIIISVTQGLGWCFKFINQPKVIAEVIGGIILGPTVFGRVPGFTDSIFPKQSQPFLNLVSTIGLILFLFVVGLEVDISVAKRNGKNSAFISLAGIGLPFALGAAVAVPVYHNFVDTEAVTFGHFLLFICVSMSITAFPVLCRILTATKLLDTTVGIIVLSAGVGNDVLGWVLLALTLALSGSSSGVSSVYILLAAVGWSILLLWPIRKAFIWFVRRSGSLEHGPTQGVMTVTLLIVFASAFMTGIIGVHPIFGGFIAGLIIPHEGGFAIAITERIDDLVAMLFLPIYFVLSGLQTDLGLLNTGKAWGFVVMLCVVAFAGKFVGCAATAKLLKYSWRESGAIGMLMSCKGLVELIVLNVGLEAGIIGKELFSMTVLVAVVLTFATTPCTLWIYPRKYHARGTAGMDKKALEEERNKATRDAFLGGAGGSPSGGRDHTTRLLVVLQKLEHLGATMFITQLLEPEPASRYLPGTSARITPADVADPKRMEGDVATIEKVVGSESSAHGDRESTPGRESNDGSANGPVRIDALKIVELTGRTFSVMQSAEKDQLLHTDDALQLYKQFGRLRGLDVTPHITIVGQDSYSSAVSEYASDLDSQLIVVPWTLAGTPQEAVQQEQAAASGSAASPATPTQATLGGVFANDGSPMYTHFIRKLFAESKTDVALFIDRGFGGATVTPPGSGQHIFLPFFGGPDDRLALRLVVQLCRHAHVTATVHRVTHKDVSDAASETATLDEEDKEAHKVHQAALLSNQLTIGGPKLEEQLSSVHSETADNVAWTYYTNLQATGAAGTGARDSAMERMVFSSQESATPLAAAIEQAEKAMAASSGESMWRPLLVVTGRGRRAALYNHEREVTALLAKNHHNPTVGAELRKTVGDAPTALMLAGGQMNLASYFVCEAGG